MQGLSLTLSSLFHFPFIAFLFLIGTRGSMSDKCFCIMHTFSFKKKKLWWFFCVWLWLLYINGYCMANPALLFYHRILCFQAHFTILWVHLDCWVFLLNGILWLESECLIYSLRDGCQGWLPHLSRPQNPHCLCQCPLLNFAPSSKDHFLSAHIHLPHVFKYPYDISSFLDVLEFF